MFVFKRFVILNEVEDSGISGVCKFENFNEKTIIIPKISTPPTFDLVIKIKDDIIIKEFNGEDIILDTLVDIASFLQVIVIKDKEVVAEGASAGLKKNYESLYMAYLESLPKIEPIIETAAIEQEKENEVKTEDIIDNKEKINNVDEEVIKEEIISDEPLFYKKIEDKLDELFSMHKRFKPLEDAILNSKWVKIEIPNENHYVVGIIYDEDKPALICYGIPDKDNLNPPDEDEYKMQWFNLDDGGYWIMYQSAIDGSHVEV